MIVIALAVAVVAGLRGLWSPCGLSMVSSLNPVAERARGHRPFVTAAWYVLGALGGGALLGSFCAALGFGVDALHLTLAARFGVTAVAAAGCALSDLQVGPVLPDHPRQVDETWLVRYRRWIYAFGFGAQVGAGFATYIMTAAVYLTAVTATLSGPAAALLTGVVFGLVRGLCVLVSARVSSPERLRALLRRIESLGGASLGFAVLAQIAVAGSAAFLALGPYVAGAVGVALATVALMPLVLGRTLVREGGPRA